MALPQGYAELLEDLEATVASARRRAQRVVSTELLVMCWDIRHAVLQRQDAEGWGIRVIDRLAAYLRDAFPAARGDRPAGCWTIAVGPRDGAAGHAR